MINRLSKLFAIILLMSVPSLMLAQYYSYSKRNGQVYYDGKVIHGADSHSFRDLGYGYSKDRNHVYRYGTILEYVDPSSFKVDRRFSSDNRPSHGRPDGGYHNCERPGYYVSTFDVFYNGEKIPGASGSSFVILKEGYAKDAFNVYWMGKKISGASTSSFVCLGNGYAKDAFNAYWKGRKINGSSTSSFKVTRGFYAEDAFDVYFKGEKLK